MRDVPLNIYIFQCVLLLIVTSVHGNSRSRSHVPLRLNGIHFKSPLIAGDSVRLYCDYQLGNETLYSLKWYKDMVEFFRYRPESNPQFKIFPQAGVEIDISRSDNSTVYLRSLSLESIGNYSCEVSSDAPYFRADRATKELEVIIPPPNDPTLVEDKSEYKLGDNVSISCISGKAKPAPELKWYINEQEATSGITVLDITVYPNGLEASRLSLHFQFTQDVLHDGKVELKCVATFRDMHAVAMKEIIPME